ncbi:unnamed protein product, partial [marine sediment metagenome]
MVHTDKNLRIAIHHRPGSFSDRWIEYCKEKVSLTVNDRGTLVCFHAADAVRVLADHR